ncbi:hypothetical protein EG68_05009 [Paragonimus skrjabini miyazakii]|uniref:WAPL domain-containing protein n=1 Tax=Paragonimus skrjabini miyazakii TaxID=59628 RepID=A0A8S9YY65_9TREM|nr:hypothetical protein EG68_05009 [Paragonimus skrjabini miyazakii]
MNVRYKTFANRTNQDIKFDQLLMTMPLAARPSSTNTNFAEPAIGKSPEFTQLSPRKRVNVVSFTPGSDDRELITKSPEKPTPTTGELRSQQTSELFHSDSTSQLHSVTIKTSPNLSFGEPSLRAGSFHPISGTRSCMPTNVVPCSAYNITYNPKTTLTGTVISTARMSNPITHRSHNTGGIRIVSACPSASIIPDIHDPTAIDSGRPKPITKPIMSTSVSPTVVTRTRSTTVLYPQSSAINASALHSNCSDARPSTLAVLNDTVNKPFVLRRSSTTPANQSVGLTKEQEDTDCKRPAARSLLCGKKKRAAYNPRPWQQEADPEDSSPTKQPKINMTRLTLNHHYPVTTSTTSNSGHTTPDPSDSYPDQTKSLVCPPDFEFPDSDGEEDKTKIPTAISRTKLPRLTSLIGGQHVTQTMKPTSTSPVSTISPAQPSPSEFALDGCDERNANEEEEEEEEEELEDVKPWFCPTNRRQLDKPKNNKPTLTTENRVQRTQKPLFTVVQKVSEAHVCQERGETQHLLDDVDYLVAGLGDFNQPNTRALSVLTLANKCLNTSFRYLVHAHGLVKRICANLHDAHKDYTLALTSAGLFFILSRDRDPNVFDADSLPVMIKLLHAPDSITVEIGAGGSSQLASRANKEAERVRTRVRQLLEGLQRQQSSRHGTCAGQNQSSGGNGVTSISTMKRPVLISSASAPASLTSASLTAGTAGLNTRHLQMTRQLTAADLVLESILNLGTRKAADWFKAELRLGGGLDRVADAAVDAVDYLADLDPASRQRRGRRPNSVWRSSANPTGLDGFALDKLRRVCHYTKLLENMTYMNSDNQTYLVRYRDRLLVNRFVCCIRLCASHLPKQSLVTANATVPTSNCNTTLTPSGGSLTVGPQSAIGKISAGHLQDQSILVDCILGIFRFLVNVSHNEFAGDRLGGCPGLLETILECVLHLPPRMPQNKRFDLLVLTLCLLVNMCEHCPENRTRLVHLDIPKPRAASADGTSDGDDDEDEDEEEDEDQDAKPTDNHTERANGLTKRLPWSSALDELVGLFLVREEQARNHDFERDDEDAAAAAAERRRREQIESATANQLDVAGFGRATHVEEAGLKWRLIEDRKATGMFGARGNRVLGGRDRKRSRSRARQKCREAHRRGLAQVKLAEMDKDEGEESSEDDDEEEEEGEEASDLDISFGDDDEAEEEEDDDDDDDSVASGADVEFVADTQEEQEKLAERMSQAQQHMEDSVVAAYVALLLGCILQSSRRYAEKIRTKLPDGQFRPLAIMLAKLLSFLSLTKGVGSSGSETILRIVRILESQDNNISNQNKNTDADCPLPSRNGESV